MEQQDEDIAPVEDRSELDSKTQIKVIILSNFGLKTRTYTLKCHL